VPGRLPAIIAEAVIAVLERNGFARVRQSGSHVVMRHPDGRWTTVPMHKGRDPARGTLRQILRDANLSVDDLS
jgi:predicted RNA binding protein YcfA (HicA-like mRNA interferase family)